MLATTETIATPTPNTASERTIRLTTSDSSSFTIPIDILKCSGTIMDYFKTAEPKTELSFTVPHVTAPILEIVLNYCQDHSDDEPYNEETFLMDESDEELKELSLEDLLQLTMAADILKIPRLVRSTAEVLAPHLEGKSPEEIRALFDIDNLVEEEIVDEEGEE